MRSRPSWVMASLGEMPGDGDPSNGLQPEDVSNFAGYRYFRAWELVVVARPPP